MYDGIAYILDKLRYVGHTPTRAHADDAGLDLYVQHDAVVQPGAMVDLDLGVAVKAPPGTWTLLTGRSSTMRNLGLLVAQGIIDPGYTGPLYATVYNLRTHAVTIRRGDRVAQLIVMPNLTASVELCKVDELPYTSRGANGFGSSGA
jgi:dUTP pyrophosphatase